MKYAVVSEPEGRYLWILSRTPKMNDDVFQGILRRLTENGYSTETIQKTLQPSS